MWDHNRKQQKFSQVHGMMTHYSLIGHIYRSKKNRHQQWDKKKAGLAQEVQDSAGEWGVPLLNTSPVKSCRANGDQGIHATAETLFPLSWEVTMYILSLNSEILNEKVESLWAFELFWEDVSPEASTQRRCENSFKSWVV